MSSRSERKKKKLLLILFNCFVFGIGYYILNEVSTWFEVPLGVTFHVILGCSLMAISGIYKVTLSNNFILQREEKEPNVFI